MKVSFKPLSLAVAVSAAAAGYAGSINASSQERWPVIPALAMLQLFLTIRSEMIGPLVCPLSIPLPHSSHQGSITSRHRFNGCTRL